MSNENGGPAFPYSGVHKGENVNQIIDSHGMTLRDYLAANAMQGMISAPMGKFKHGNSFELTESAYRFADAMLRARGQ